MQIGVWIYRGGLEGIQRGQRQAEKKGRNYHMAAIRMHCDEDSILWTHHEGDRVTFIAKRTGILRHTTKVMPL
jgi:hypothetical protein